MITPAQPQPGQDENSGGASSLTRKTQRATFAAGCFWGVEASFSGLDGVLATQVGYCGGTVPDPSYRLVCSGTTGHAEALEMRFDPGLISYEELLEHFFSMHDPTLLNRQGPDVGTQYRSAVFYHSEHQRLAAIEAKHRLESSGVLVSPVVTEIVEAAPFYRAEEYHQQYLHKHQSASCPTLG